MVIEQERYTQIAVWNTWLGKAWRIWDRVDKKYVETNPSYWLSENGARHYAENLNGRERDASRN